MFYINNAVSFTGGQRVKIKLANNMKDYTEGFNLGSTLPKDKLDIELRKCASDPRRASFLQGLLDGIDSLVDSAKKLGKLEKSNPQGKIR